VKLIFAYLGVDIFHPMNEFRKFEELLVDVPTSRQSKL